MVHGSPGSRPPIPNSTLNSKSKLPVSLARDQPIDHQTTIVSSVGRKIVSNSPPTEEDPKDFDTRMQDAAFVRQEVTDNKLKKYKLRQRQHALKKEQMLDLNMQQEDEVNKRQWRGKGFNRSKPSSEHWHSQQLKYSVSDESTPIDLSDKQADRLSRQESNSAAVLDIQREELGEAYGSGVVAGESRDGDRQAFLRRSVTDNKQHKYKLRQRRRNVAGQTSG